MKVEDLIVLGKGKVHSDFAKMLLADLLGMNSLELLFHLDDEVGEEIQEEYRKKLSLLMEKKPVQYVIGNVSFCGLPLKVDSRVLIPRFETEELVENTVLFIEQIFPDNRINIVDLGCGSGAIGIALKKKIPSSSVLLVDLSKDALEVAQENAKSLELNVAFLQSDMLEKVEGKFDVIVSNPPYIREDEKIEDIVRENEPHLALYGGKDGLDCYRKILSTCKKNLKEKFLIAFEIGYLQKEEIEKIAREYLENVEIVCKKDLGGKDRMIFIYPA